MYKVMLVDDETVNYQLFEKMVNWKEKGFEIAAVAADGLEALQKYDEVKPDLIFMDIQLPLMDGLECIRYIRKEDEKVRIVIVSAYGDFSYAQKAIQYGVQDFLLKPVSRLMLNQLVDKMKDYLDNEIMAGEAPNWGKEQRQYLDQILQGEEVDEAAKASLRDSNFFGVLITDADGGYLSDSLRKNILEELLGSQELREYSAIEYSPDTGHSMILWKNDEMPEKFMEEFQRLAETAGYLCQIYLYKKEKESVREWLEKFVGVENYGFYELKSGRYDLDDCPFSEEEIGLEKLEQIVARAVTGGSYEEITEMFDQIFQTAARKRIHPRIVKDVALDSLVRIKFVLKRFDQQDSFLLMRNIRMENIHNMQNAGKLKQFVIEKVSETFEEIKASFCLPGKKLVFRANAFTEVSYQDVDFSVQKVADYIGISKNYFTSQYKEQTGSGFWEYVIKLRIEKAKELLMMTDEMVGSIAREVGYESEYHFSRKFKEYTGQSPKNYRKSVEK